MKRGLFAFSVVVAVSLPWWIASGASSAPAHAAPALAETRPAAPETLPAERTPATLRADGIRRALAGEFEAGLKLLAEAATLDPKDETATAAKGLVHDYLRHLSDAQGQRAAEYAQAVGRVERYLLAEEHLPKLAKKTVKELHDKVLESVTAYNKANDGVGNAQDAFKDAYELRARAAADHTKAAELRKALAALKDDPEKTKPLEAQLAALDKEGADAEAKAKTLDAQAANKKSQSLEQMDKAVAALKDAAKVLAGNESKYAKTFQVVAAAAVAGLSDYRSAWEKAKAGDAAQMDRQADLLKALDDKAIESLADIDALVDDKPWRKALIQARVAVQLAAKTDQPAQQGWYKALVALAEARGAKAVADIRWYDALDAYVGLQDLEEDNERYIQKVKTIRKHVRALGLYGPPRNGGSLAAARDGETPDPAETPKPAATSKPASKPSELWDETWKDLVEGVDADMVLDAISQINSLYVTTVDYRKLGLAALDSVQVLAATPQAAYSFKGLEDTRNQEEFLREIARRKEVLEKRDRPDHLDLQLALQGVVRASERTVQIPTSVIAYEFTEGLLGELDKFSAMVWPHDVTDFHKNTMGHFHGVGIQITKEEGEPLKVISPLPDSPALKAGIRAGDAIIAVNGAPTRNRPLNKLIDMIMGEKGTKVVLTVERVGLPASMDFEVIRDKISIQTVKGWRREGGGKWRYLVDPTGDIGYIQLTQFTDETPDEVEAALADLKKELAQRNQTRLESLVLDLRFNPGGLLRSAASVANEFLRGGLIVSTRGRQKGSSDVSADDRGDYLAGNLVVLVNEHSASAAEIVSGALKDWKRGIIVGGRTYGKGSVQNVIPIRNHRALLKLTTAHYYLPSGRLLHRQNGQKEWGVDPDVEVKFTPKQTKRWIEIRRKTGLLLADEAPKTQEDDLKKQYDDDIQLQTAVLLLELMKLQDGRPVADAAAARAAG